MSGESALPTWAPCVARRQIHRLYEWDAKGIYDEDLIDEVGYGLLARCETFLTANKARAGELPCPKCGETVRHTARRDEVLHCPCGWELPWAACFKTIQHKQLSGAEPVLEQFRQFVARFPKARTPREKMLLIDRLIHGFHWFCKGEVQKPTRPVAVNLIEGSLGAVVAFLDNLTYGDGSTPGTRESLAEWDRHIEVNREWYPSRRRRG